MAKRIVTLDIESTTIRLLETDGPRVVRWASAFLEPGIWQDGAIANPQALSARIRQLWRSSGMKGREVVASLGGPFSLGRILSVRPVTGQQLATTVDQQIRQFLPTGLDQMHLSWQAIGVQEGAQQVLVLGASRDLTETLVRVTRAAGLTLAALELRSVALARAVNRRQALVANVEPTGLDIAVIVNGVPQVMRSLTWEEDSLPPKESAGQVAEALELTVDFYNSRNPANPSDPSTPLFLAGQVAEDPAFVEEMRARVPYFIEPLSVPLECPRHLSLFQYAINLGLALRQLSLSKGSESISRLPPLSVNLLPEAYRPRKRILRQGSLVLAGLVGFALLLFLYQGVTGVLQENSGLRAQVSALEQRIEQIRVVNSRRLQLTTTVEDFQELVAPRGSFVEDMAALEGAAGPGVRVGAVTWARGEITVAVQADTFDLAAGYVEALRVSERFSEAEPSQMAGSEGSPLGISFSVAVTPVGLGQ
ncbi:MAG: pilus assembly protein PilM [Dehalococcoidia bacterium]